MEEHRLQVQAVANRTQISSRKAVGDVWENIAGAVNGMDRAVFAEMLNGLWVACGRREYPDKTVLRVWYFCLHDLTESQFAHGIMRYLTERSSEFLTVQIIRELSGVQQQAEVAAIEAWDAAINAVRIAGSYQSPSFSDPVISRVIESVGGWVWFCGRSPEDLRKFVRARFLKTYDAFAKSGAKEPVKLLSLIDMTGGRSEVVKIGQTQAAEANGLGPAEAGDCRKPVES